MNDLRDIATRLNQVEQHMQIMAERQRAFSFRQILAVTILAVLLFLHIVGLYWLHSLSTSG